MQNEARFEKTLKICASRNDAHSKNLERRLLSVPDLVAKNARHHISYRLEFERKNIFFAIFMGSDFNIGGFACVNRKEIKF